MRGGWQKEENWQKLPITTQPGDALHWQSIAGDGSRSAHRDSKHAAGGKDFYHLKTVWWRIQKLYQTRWRSTALLLFNSDISVVLQLRAMEGIYSGILWQGKGKPSTWDGLERPNTHDHPKIDDSTTLCSSYSTQYWDLLFLEKIVPDVLLFLCYIIVKYVIWVTKVTNEWFLDLIQNDFPILEMSAMP